MRVATVVLGGLGLVTATAASAATYYVPMGTPVQLSTRAEISTRDNRAGTRFYLDVAEPLRAAGQVVIPAGSVAVGEIVRSERSSNFGKPGRIETRLLYIETPERRVPIVGRTATKGRDGTLGAAAATVAFGVIGGVLVRGTSGRVPAGTVLTAELKDDLLFVAEPGLQAAPAIRTEPNRAQVAAR